MQAPKMLPWLARKAGISDTRAEALWEDAIAFATGQANWVGTPDYWGAAVSRLVELMNLESQALRSIAIEGESCSHSANRHCGVTCAQNQRVAA